MSVINQVLKDLDKRGASTNIGEATIRVVHGRSHRSALLLIATGAIGMLLAGGIAWMVLQGGQYTLAPPLVTTVAGQSLPVESVPVLPASQPVATLVTAPLLKIDSVSPDPVFATGKPQTITLYGSNFSEGASVTLTDGEGRVYANRPIVTLAPEQIVLKLNPGKKSGNWLVEVIDSKNKLSAKYAFTARAVPAAASPLVTNLTKAPEQLVPVSAKAPVVLAEGITKSPVQISTQQQAENEFRRAYELLRMGRNTEALAGFELALKLDAGHEIARKSLVSLLLEIKRSSEAENVLKLGLQLNLRNTDFALLLARMQVGRNELSQALDTVQKSLPYADKQADYQAFVAALLQRQNRHKEAIDFYRIALNLKPQSGVWQMGMGISLRTEKRTEEAREAFNRALESKSLNADLQAFVTQQLKEL